MSFPSWLPFVNNVAPNFFADFTTEGGDNHYWFLDSQFSSFAAWFAALGGVVQGSANFDTSGWIIDASNFGNATPISSWYNASVGVIYAKADDTATGAHRIISINDGSQNNSLDLIAASGGNSLTDCFSGSVLQFFFPTSDAGQSPYSAGISSRAAISISAAGAIYVRDGGAADTNGALTMPVSTTTVNFGQLLNGSNLVGHISQVGYWPTTTTVAQLQSLTRGIVTQFDDPMAPVLTRVPARAFTRKHYYNELEKARKDSLAAKAVLDALDDRGRADHDFELAQAIADHFDQNMTPSNYAKAMDAKERLEKARKARDHHYFMDVVKKAWADHDAKKK